MNEVKKLPAGKTPISWIRQMPTSLPVITDKPDPGIGPEYGLQEFEVLGCIRATIRAGTEKEATESFRTMLQASPDLRLISRREMAQSVQRGANIVESANGGEVYVRKIEPVTFSQELSRVLGEDDARYNKHHPGHVPCSKCGGDSCPNCEGGRITCPDCGGEGEVEQLVGGSIEHGPIHKSYQCPTCNPAPERDWD